MFTLRIGEHAGVLVLADRGEQWWLSEHCGIGEHSSVLILACVSIGEHGWLSEHANVLVLAILGEHGWIGEHCWLGELGRIGEPSVFSVHVPSLHD